MAIGIVDADFNLYAPIQPNLECAKICTYWRRHNEFIKLIDEIDLIHYSKNYYRKDYDNGDFPSEIGDSRVEFGGRAFSPLSYKALPQDIEETIPSFLPYGRYEEIWSDSFQLNALFHKLLSAQHARLSLDGHSIWDNFEKAVDKKIPSSKPLILHDYDLNSIEGAPQFVLDWCKGKRYIGTKFPIQADEPAQILRWTAIKPSPQIFNFQYNGVLEDVALYEISGLNLALLENLLYNVGSKWKTSQDFVVNGLPQIFAQAAFLHNRGIQISLIDRDDFLVLPELKNLLSLLNGWIRRGKKDDAITFYDYARNRAIAWEKNEVARYDQMTADQIRAALTLVLNLNQDLFAQFHTLTKTELRGGKFGQV